MPKAAKYFLLGLAFLFVVAAGSIAFIAATFDPNAHKPRIIALVQEQKQRTLTIPGDIRLSFFPKISADLGRVSLSERNASTQFASVESAKVSFALLPLLSRQLIVDRVEIKELNAQLRRDKDGTTNYDDLLAKQESNGQPVRVDIHSVTVANGRIALDDQMARREIEITELNLQTGRIANAVPGNAQVTARIRSTNPHLDASLIVKTKFNFDLDRKRYAFDALEGELKGATLGITDLLVHVAGNADLQPETRQFALAGLKLSATGKQAGRPLVFSLDAPKLIMAGDKLHGGKVSGEAGWFSSGRNVNMTFLLPAFEGTRQAFQLPALTLAATLKDATTDAKVSVAGSLTGDFDRLLFSSPALNATLSGKQGATTIAGTISTGITANLPSGRIDLPGIAIDVTLPNPSGGAMKLGASGSALAELNRQTMSAKLRGKLDDSSFDATLGLVGYAPAAYTFDIDVDKLDADRYRARTPVGAGQGKARPADRLEKPIDLSALRQLQASGNLRVGSLKAENIRLSNLRLSMKAGGGQLDINPLSASLYGGTMTGAAGVVAATSAKFFVRQSLSGINLGPLLKDAIGKDPVEGRGNVMLDVTTEGGLVAQLKKNLNGKVEVALRDGAVKGFNVGQIIRTARSRIGELRGTVPPQSGTGNAAEKSDFSELTGSFNIVRGIARNQDLRAKSPLLRVEGAGNIDFGEDRLDYLVKATIVSTLQGQGGPELQALKGLTVPVRLSGPFTSIGYQVDFTGIAEDLVRKQLDSRKDEIKGRVEDQLKGKLKGLFGR
ncbi:AsmA family protein [Noviherbaspirillum suwonense]|uniref:AsmA protein n=1 Tax=Noviherbaspirillum suwonense TaxID=1224511 RepID=A0ABY1PQX0_9BURK|nr:AsmA family protein [Noviherbaspirillum suwonense]SMP43129.1 AsmA protein [Noviherbaspirillum suwonense]